jgi:hypothetical protein
MTTARVCEFCGWNYRAAEPLPIAMSNCSTSTAALQCRLNQENRRKFGLRFKGVPVPPIVRSVRYQDATKAKFGAYYEFLQAVE